MYSPISGVESADQTPSKKSKSSDVTHSKSTTRGEATRKRKLPKGKRKSLGEIEELENDIKIEMERASTESLADGLSKVEKFSTNSFIFLLVDKEKKPSYKLCECLDSCFGRL